MKIALLTDGIYPYVIGGMQKHSYYLVKYLAKNKIHIDLFHFNQSSFDISDLSIFTQQEKEYIHAIVLDFPKLDNMPGHYIRESYKYSELIFEKIKNELHSYDFIYSKGFTGWKLIEEKKGGLKCPPIGVKFHGYEMFQKAPNFKVKLQHLILRKPVKWISSNADIVFSYGGKITEILQQLNVAQEKIIEIPTGIEEAWINVNQLSVGKLKRFVFIGRYERRKGVKELHTVLNRLNKINNFIFEFIGAMPVDKQIKSHKIIYHGEIRDGEIVKRILETADVLVCPSHSEGMPNVIMEGMASGLAIIATDVGAISSIVNDRNGLLIKPGNLKELDLAIKQFINMPENDLLILRKASINKIKTGFLWSAIANITISKLKKISNEI